MCSAATRQGLVLADHNGGGAVDSFAPNPLGLQALASPWSPSRLSLLGHQERDLRAFAKRGGHRIVAVFKETVSGARTDRVERRKAMALTQARDRRHPRHGAQPLGPQRPGPGQTLDDLHGWRVSVLAQNGATDAQTIGSLVTMSGSASETSSMRWRDSANGRFAVHIPVKTRSALAPA
jgi:hypothetical protein